MAPLRQHRTTWLWVLASLAAPVVGCASSPSALDVQGPRAATIGSLWWVMLALAAVVTVIALGCLAYALVRSRRADGAGLQAPQAATPSSWLGGTRFVVAGGVGLPVIILTPLLVANVFAMAADHRPDVPPAEEIEVIGRQFWWEVRYPARGIVTANEIHIPAGRPVQLTLTSPDVIHSFWVPQLMGKVDMIPGRTNVTWIQADQPGEYRGQCAEFCGIQHARMAFLIIAEPQEEFDAWLAQQQAPRPEPTDPLVQAGRTAFMRPSCMGCHAIRGTPAQGQLGPDLSDFGSRRTIAGAALPNNPGTVAAWIANPQELKPGNQMPDLNIDLQTARAIAAYLETLR